MSRTACKRILNMTSKNKCLTLNENIELIESGEKDNLTVKQFSTINEIVDGEDYVNIVFMY